MNPGDSHVAIRAVPSLRRRVLRGLAKPSAAAGLARRKRLVGGLVYRDDGESETDSMSRIPFEDASPLTLQLVDRHARGDLGAAGRSDLDPAPPSLPDEVRPGFESATRP